MKMRRMKNEPIFSGTTRSGKLFLDKSEQFKQYSAGPQMRSELR
jgi:hypothetical protein